MVWSFSRTVNPIPNDYFESLHYDFISRCDGDEWPE